MVKVLVIGAGGQLGLVLTNALKEKYGEDNVIPTDLFPNVEKGIEEKLDATDYDAVHKIVEKHQITQIYHLAAILSAKGEINPLQTWDINLKTLFNVLEVARLQHIDKVFFPSSIAVFGSAADKVNTPQNAFLNPLTVYGMSKAAGENWGQYYFSKYGVDVRSLRYPGVVGYQSMPGGGTTDYAVDIYHKAVKGESFTCYLKDDARLPMIFMDDAIRATLELMEAPKEAIKVRTSYNLSGIDFTPAEVVASIQKWYPDFSVAYEPDARQAIAEGWPSSINDDAAKNDWQWQPTYSLDAMSEEMIMQLKKKYTLENQI